MYFAALLGSLILSWFVSKYFSGNGKQNLNGAPANAQAYIIVGSGTHNQCAWPKLYAVFPGGWNGGGGLVHIYNRSFHRQAADWYVFTYYQSHGCWPVGQHSFNVRYSKDGTAPVRTPIGDCSGVRRLTIKFVKVSEEDRADYEGSDLRYEIKTLFLQASTHVGF